MNKQETKPIDIEHEMQQSYLDYAMSVIISRAIPDARDGLKPVQRRILYAMYDMGIRPDSDYKKSARIVGEVLGKYHPHGDTAVYDAMARLAQDFTIRYPLVDGQGNFGSVDGDSPAAMRYTEAKLDKFSMEMLEHIDQNTVDFSRNFDDTLSEPVVLPSIIPNLLVNGASGIAVGMATNIPPHNLGEVIDAIIYILHQWDEYSEIGVDDLMKFVKGPDFPTGGIIVLEDARNELVSAYATGRGRLMVRGRVHLEDMGKGRSRLIITEIPYQVNKSGLIERIAQLVRDNVIEGISDLRDESDRQGMRIVIEIAKTGDPEKILRKLYKHTPLQTTFGIILLALVDNSPRVLNLKQALKVFIDHQLEVIRRKVTFELEKAERRAHILAGLLIAIQHLDEIISIIRNADDEKQARSEIMQKFQLDEEQAQAILDMPLKRLTHLENSKLQEEYTELEKSITEMKDLLASPERMREMLEKELLDVRKKFSDPRRTQIAVLGEGISSKELLTANTLVEADEVFVGLTPDGKIGRCEAAKAAEKDFAIPPWIVRSDTQKTVYIVSDTGKAFGIYVETLPKVDAFADGIDFGSISGWSSEEKISAIFTLSANEKNGDESAVITITENAILKKTSTAELPFASTQSFTLCKVNPGDRLLTVLVSEENSSNIMLVSRKGMAIRFDQTDLRPMGLIATGVNGMKLKEDDRLAAALLVTETDYCCFVSSSWGLGKIAVNEFPKQGRYGQGVIAIRMADDDSIAGAVKLESGKTLLLLHYGKGKTRPIRLTTVKQIKRARQLEPTIKMVNQNVMGLSLVLLEKAEKGTEPDEEPETATKVKKHKDNDLEDAVVPPAPSNTDREDANSIGGQSSDPEQYSLF